MGTVSGTVHLRPARAGLLMTTVTAPAVVRACSLACSAWGGMYFPILHAADPELRRLTELLALDFWHPIDDDPATAELCETPGLRWQGRSPYGPFDPPRDHLCTRLLPPDQIRLTDDRPRVLPVWDDEDPLANLYAVWLGWFADDVEGDRQRSVYGNTASVMELPRAGNFPDLGAAVTPVLATGARLTYTGQDPGAVVVLIGDDPSDLARLWEVRAMGGQPFPWPVAHADRFEAPARAWLSLPATAVAAHQFQSGDGSQRGQAVRVFGGDHPVAEVQRVSAVVESAGWRAFASEPYVGRGWTGHHPVQADNERSFTASVTREDWRVDLPMPQALSPVVAVAV